MLLLLGLAVVAVGIFEAANTEFYKLGETNVVTLALSLGSTLVAGIMTFLNPASRWYQLRYA